MELNANHAGWMHFAPLWDHFHKGEYEQALECANRVDVPGLFWPYLVMASACGHLGRRAEAAAAVRDLLALDPEFAAHARSNVGTWHFASGLMDPILEGLRKAGLAIPETDDSSGSPKPKATVRAKTDQAKSGTDAEAVRADEGFWVAVLPFKYSGGNADLTALADGMTEEIVTGLSRFSYLRVIALGSTARYANQAVDIRSAGKELGARYVMEGSLRQAGARLRVAVQLVDTISGAHLWAETYDRAFSRKRSLTLQDDLVPRIVSTVADMHGVLPRSMSEVVRQKSADQMSPYEALLRSFGYNERFTPEDLAEVRACLERAVQQAPNNAECWAMLSLMYANEYGHWDNATPDSLDRSLRAARKAVEAAPLHSLPYYALAQALYFQERIYCVSSRGGPGDFAEPDGWRHGRVHGYAHCLLWRLGARVRFIRQRLPTESQSSGMVLLPGVARFLPEKRLSQSPGPGVPAQRSPELLHPCGVGHVLRATRPDGGGAQGAAGHARAETELRRGRA